MRKVHPSFHVFCQSLFHKITVVDEVSLYKLSEVSLLIDPVSGRPRPCLRLCKRAALVHQLSPVLAGAHLLCPGVQAMKDIQKDCLLCLTLCSAQYISRAIIVKHGLSSSAVKL